MHFAAPHGPRYALRRSPRRWLCAAFPIRSTATYPRPKQENETRPQPITEHISLRPQPNPRAQSIGILGGGITALSTAWHVSRFLPNAKITVYEKENRLGGWLDSEVVQVDGGEVIFEWGPRSLRPDFAGSGKATILLIQQLGLLEDIVGIGKRSPAALNRFLYYGDRLVQMPGPNPNIPGFLNLVRNLYKVLTEPIFDGLFGSILAENWIQPRPSNMMDESVGDFIRRRFGKTAADNLASALFHGIYAGDIYKLSARTLLPALWHMETRDPEGGGILLEMTDIAFKGHGLMQHRFGRFMDLLERMEDAETESKQNGMLRADREMSVYTLGTGLQTIIRKLQEKLKQDSRVEFRLGSDVVDLKFDPEVKKTTVITDSTRQTLDPGHRSDLKNTRTAMMANSTGQKQKDDHDKNNTSEPLKHDYIVSTLSAKKLLDFTRSSASARGAKVNNQVEQALEDSNRSVNVGVVNLYYSNPELIPSHLRGFGYLIPRSVATDQNPERALGVIFSSESSGARGKDAITTMENPKHLVAKGFQEIFAQVTPADRQSPAYKTMKTHYDKENFADEPETITRRLGQDTAPGTKLTVMLGGHWWEDWTESDLPTNEQLIEMAQSILARHLKITESPTVAKARMNKNCIPQYTVGYRQRMTTIHRGLMEEFQGRVKVAGPWWQGGVGVNDCTFSAHMTAFNMREEWDDETGLKHYTEPEKWLILDRRTQTFSPDYGR